MVRVRWQVGVSGIVRGLTKNAFAGMDYSLAKVIVSSIATLIICYLPYVCVFLTEGAAWWPYFLTLAAVHLTYGIFLKLNQFAFWKTVLLPVTLGVILFAIWRSTYITLTQHGINWRGTHYDLKALRAGMV